MIDSLKNEQIDYSTKIYCDASQKGGSPFFCFERVDSDNYQFWDFYRRHSEETARFFQYFKDAIKYKKYLIDTDYFEDFKKIGYDESTYKELVESVKQLNNETFGSAGVQGGCSGMQQVLTTSQKDKKVFMVYATKKPVDSPHKSSFVFENFKNILMVKDHQDFFDNIILSMVFITGNNGPTVTHYGIFRNPLSFLEKDYKGLSMKLHGFSAKMGLTLFHNKKFMVTQPLSSMATIFEKNLKKGSMHIGTNEDLKQFNKLDVSDQKLLKNYPPIYHIEKNINSEKIEKIAKNDVDLLDYIDSLPDEKAEYISKSDRLDFSGYTVGARRTFVDLTELSKFYIDS